MDSTSVPTTKPGSISKYPTKQYLPGTFVISSGSVLFRLNSSSSSSSEPSPKQFEICLLHETTKNEILLPKGRKDQNETIEKASLRETYEETGYLCEFMPVKMDTRAPTPLIPNPSDEVMQGDGIVEPFAMTIRDLPDNRGVKIIWWYITIVKSDDGTTPKPERVDYEHFRSEWFRAEEAAEKLTYQLDGELVQKAWDVVRETHSIR